MKVDRESAARFGADVLSVGNAVQMVTNGLKLSTYRPEDATDEVDIRVRLPENWRSLDQFGRLTLSFGAGARCPWANFVSFAARPQGRNAAPRRWSSALSRFRPRSLKGIGWTSGCKALREAVGQPPEGIVLRVGGEEEDQQEAANFLGAGLPAIAMCSAYG